MKRYSQPIQNEADKPQLHAFLPEDTGMKPARKILSDEQAQALISSMIKQGLPLQGTHENH